MAEQTPPAVPTAEELLSLNQPASVPVATPTKLRRDFYDGSFVEAATQDELTDKVAKRWEDLTKHTRDVEAENATLRQKTQQVAQAINLPQNDPNITATKFWELANANKIGEAVAVALADYLKLDDPSALPQAVQRWDSVADRYTTREVVGAFNEMAPDFPLGDALASEVLTKKLSEMGVRSDQLPPPELMLAAHEICKKENRYQGTTYAAPAQAAPPAGLPPVAPLAQPLPVITQGSGTQPAESTEEMANRMTPAELRRALETMVANGAK